ncbi:MAG: acyl-CoA synthetase FdrA [Candidatus Atribacteria bacterium]|nr:acyl-CoA synthetase FdrA [Candidatus Atribacteria bacterium]
MALKYLIKNNTYYDSVTLMIITREVKKIEGVKEVIVGMGTELNKELAENLNLLASELQKITPNDFFISLDSVDDNIAEGAFAFVDELLNKKKAESEDYQPSTIESALKYMPDANLVLISLPGKYAAREVKNALLNDKHVMLFSDNVALEEEIDLKKLARQRGLLMMGPDCGTAIINHVALAFANVVRKGSIGIVGASGTGIQEVTVMIDKLGSGISQAIGTGGRDLKAEVGGIMMIEGLKALQNDPLTEVIVLISKPPDKEVARKVLSILKEGKKPSVVYFVGGDPGVIKEFGFIPGLSLEDTAHKAVAIAKGLPVEEFTGFSVTGIDKIIKGETGKLNEKQRYIRGLYTGGTLCDEAMIILSDLIGDIYSNIPLKPEGMLFDINKSYRHSLIDLGDDEFTRGKPHPMIDPYLRQERILSEAKDREAAIILMDFVLGFGSNPDPAGEMIPYIRKAGEIAAKDGRHICMISSVCGTEGDPQNLIEQEKKLKEERVIVMPSNAQAVRLAAAIVLSRRKIQ